MNNIFDQKKLKYLRFNRSQNLEEFREKTFLKHRESLFFLEPFLPKVWYFFGLDTSTNDKQEVLILKSPKETDLREIFAKKKAIL